MSSGRAAATTRPPGWAIRRSLAGHLDHGFRPDIEGLRAVAVIAVIAFHVGIPGVSGGFIGVDVFFVVSGFLITRLILGELATNGSISLRGFWARRARRLLPASTLTVIVTVLFAQRMLPPLSMQSLATDAIAAGTFTTNFVFAHRLGDYFGAQLGLVQSVAAAALLVVGRRRAVLPVLAAAARVAHTAAESVPPARTGDDRRIGTRQFRDRPVADVEPPLAGLLPVAVADGRASRRRRLGRARHRCQGPAGAVARRPRVGRDRSSSWVPASASTRRFPGQVSPSSCRCWRRWR